MYSERMDGTDGQWDTFVHMDGAWVPDRAVGCRPVELLKGGVVGGYKNVVSLQYHILAPEPSKMLHHSLSCYLVEELVSKFVMNFEQHMELTYLAALSEKCTLVSACVFFDWLQRESLDWFQLGDYIALFFDMVNIHSVRQIPTASCRETSSHMHCKASEQVLTTGEYSPLILALKTVSPILVNEANDANYPTKALIEKVAKLPFIGAFAAQSFITVACVTGLIRNVRHAAFAEITDDAKPHAAALLSMGLKNLATVNKLVVLAANRMGKPQKTVENLLCKAYRVLDIREFVLPGQSFYKLVFDKDTGQWTVAKKRWGEAVWDVSWVVSVHNDDDSLVGFDESWLR
jgi:hypothetical protein